MNTEQFIIATLAQSMWQAGFQYTGAFEEKLADSPATSCETVLSQAQVSLDGPRS